MTKYIDADKAIDEIRAFQAQVTCAFSADWENGMMEGFDHAVGVIELMPKVDAIPVSYLKKMAETIKETSNGRSVDIIDLIIIAWNERCEYEAQRNR